MGKRPFPDPEQAPPQTAQKKPDDSGRTCSYQQNETIIRIKYSRSKRFEPSSYPFPSIRQELLPRGLPTSRKSLEGKRKGGGEKFPFPSPNFITSTSHLLRVLVAGKDHGRGFHLALPLGTVALKHADLTAAFEGIVRYHGIAAGQDGILVVAVRDTLGLQRFAQRGGGVGGGRAAGGPPFGGCFL